MNYQKIESAYIHIPFCKNICAYCDFCKMFYHQESVEKYLNALEKEIEKYYKKELLQTLYIGGGTPSSLDFREREKLFEILHKLNISNHAEVTFEVNVCDINEKLLKQLKENKVNRISIGIETVQAKFLKLIERSHTKEDVYDKVELVKKYFDNINVDFMYGFPYETKKDLEEDLKFFKSLEVPHISIYSLILEPNTKLFLKKVEPLDDSLESDMYFHIIDYLEKLGYVHYEISNFSKKGYESHHNLTYWDNLPYYGFGLGASGYIDGIRYTNTRSLNHYTTGNIRLEEEILNEKTSMENEMILGLRKIKGVKKSEFEKRYHKKIEEVFNIKDLLEKNLLEENENYIYIPKDKLYLSNSILINFIKNN